MHLSFFVLRSSRQNKIFNFKKKQFHLLPMVIYCIYDTIIDVNLLKPPNGEPHLFSAKRYQHL